MICSLIALFFRMTIGATLTRSGGRAVKIDWFLVCLAAAVGLALLAPGIGATGGPLPLGVITQIGIALVFFLHGANLSPQALASGAAKWRLHLLIQATTFVLFPVFGALIFVATEPVLPAEVRLGFFYLCALSSTISSAVATVAIARGDVPAAIFNATLSGLIGMVATPALVGLVQQDVGGHISFVDAVVDIAVKLLLPFIAGQLLRRWLAPVIAGHKPWISRLDRSVIVLIVYAAFCNSTAAGVWSLYGPARLALIFVLVAALLAIMIVVTTLVSRRLGLSRDEEITVVICGSQKSLANGAPIAQVLFAASPALGAILLPLMLYHPLQLVVCSTLARRHADRTTAEASSV